MRKEFRSGKCSVNYFQVTFYCAKYWLLLLIVVEVIKGFDFLAKRVSINFWNISCFLAALRATNSMKKTIPWQSLSDLLYNSFVE